MTLAIVVPVLNEAGAWPALAAHLQALQASDVTLQIVIVDGGSTDDTLRLAQGSGFWVLSSPRGRACQMNAGVQACRADQLLFLHADTRLPEGAAGLIMQALRTHVWGRFDVRIEGRARLLRVVAAMMNLRSRISGIATGDQAMFMTRDAFEKAGGFPEQPLMEDIALSAALKTLGRPACLRARACTSGRRWEQYGVWRTIVLMWCLRLAYWLGANPAALARAYR